MAGVRAEVEHGARSIIIPDRSQVPEEQLLRRHVPAGCVLHRVASDRLVAVRTPLIAEWLPIRLPLKPQEARRCARRRRQRSRWWRRRWWRRQLWRRQRWSLPTLSQERLREWCRSTTRAREVGPGADPRAEIQHKREAGEAQREPHHPAWRSAHRRQRSTKPRRRAVKRRVNMKRRG